MTITTVPGHGHRPTRLSPPNVGTERPGATPAAAVTIQVTLTADTPNMADVLRDLLRQLDALNHPPHPRR